LRDFLAQNYPDGVKAVGPGSFNVNTFVSRTFGFGKRNGQTVQVGQGGSGAGGRRGAGGGDAARLNLTFTAGCSNLFNRVNFGQYGGALGSAYFRLPSSAGPARQIDFNLRFSF
jgi:hypothetical protein